MGLYQEIRRHGLVKESQLARLVFVDIRPDTLNLDETQVEAAITDRTRVIAPVRYVGVCSDVEAILAAARDHDLRVVEVATQSVNATCRDENSGTFGDFGCCSFHETKNFICGEGGALVAKDPSLFERAACLRDNGTNRRSFMQGEVDHYD
jgi:dTDP-4-amino-4,6-dideoxygalactose transaminase